MSIQLSSLKKIATLLVFTPLTFSSIASAEKDSGKKYKDFTECAAIRMKEVNLEKLQKHPEKVTTKIPDGWTVVSGSGGEGHPKLLICR